MVTSAPVTGPATTRPETVATRSHTARWKFWLPGFLAAVLVGTLTYAGCLQMGSQMGMALFFAVPVSFGALIGYACRLPTWAFSILGVIALTTVLFVLMTLSLVGIFCGITLGVIFLIPMFAGLACVLLVYALACRLGARPLVAAGVAAAFLFAQAFLNFTQTGSSYVPGLACVLLALYLALASRDADRTRPWVAGAALGAGVCFWFPYALVIPAVLAAPLILYGAQRWRWWAASPSTARNPATR